MEPSSDSGGRELSGVVVDAFEARRCRGIVAVGCMCYVWVMDCVWCDLVDSEIREMLAGV
jgi:hypothetical protein